MAKLIETIQRLRSIGVFTGMIYLQEAHADDLWPLGYGIQSHSNIVERWAACDRFMAANPELKKSLHGIAIDTMDDRFIHTYGAWPERYFLTDISGQVLWASSIGDDHIHASCTSKALQQVLEVVDRSVHNVGDSVIS